MRCFHDTLKCGIICLGIAGLCCTPALAQNTAVTKPQIFKDRIIANPNFPFILSLTFIEYDITVNLDDPKVAAKFAATFKKYNVPYNAETVEDVIIHLLEKKDSAWAHEIITASQDNILRIGTGNAALQKQFISYILPIFSDADKLGALLKKESSAE